MFLFFIPGTPASSTTKTGRHDIIVAEILSKVALNTINQILSQITLHHGDSIVMYVVSYIFVIVFITEDFYDFRYTRSIIYREEQLLGILCRVIMLFVFIYVLWCLI
jgi:hypothetical protein